jgi:outer membrane protein insertion porin family
VREVRFLGNRALSDDELRGLMQNRPPSRLSLGGPAGVFREDLLSEDLDQIRNRYRSLGYLQVDVRVARTERSEDQREVTLTLEITEGAPTVVGAVEVEGTAGVLESPTSGLDLKPGARYSPETLATDRRKLGAALSSRGYVDAEVSTSSDPPVQGTEQNTVDLHFHVVLKERVRIGRVVIQQNYVTRDAVIRRVLPFGAGDPLDPAKLAEGQSGIYRLGLFRSVAVEPLQETGAVRDVAVRVSERPGGELQYGFGYDTRIGLRNFLQIGHKNLGGTGDQATLRGDINLAPNDFVPDEYIVTLDGRHPRLWAGPYDLRGTVGYQQTKRSRSIDEFSIRSFRLSSGFERAFWTGLRGSLLLEYENADIFDVDPDVILTDKDTGRLHNVSVNPILVYDGRDDAFAPTRGIFDSMRVRYGSPALGSDIHFVKVVLQHSQYVPLGDRLTWVYSGRLGVAEPLGSTGAIPLRERFFLGGRTTVRGFAENSIGPHGDLGHPAGGDLLFIVNTELRFPLFFGLIGAVFADGGGLYFHNRAISIGEFRESVGPGLRYQTPIGALSLDYGFKIESRRDESIGEVHFTIGNLF